MLNKNLFFLVFLLTNSLGSPAQNNMETVVFELDGYERLYKFYIPEDYPKSKTYPLVFVLHGGAGNANRMIRLTRARFNQLAARDGFIAVYPQGYEKSWNDGARNTFGVARNLNIDDVAYFKKVITDLDSKVNVDHRNIFVCGISNGGFMAQRLAFECSKKIKAIGVVAANLSVVQSQKKYPENPVPAIFINGTEDPLVPYNGGAVTVFRQKRGEIQSVERTIEIWRDINGCTQTIQKNEFPDIDKNDACTAEKTVYQNQENPAQKVIAIKVTGGGHTWPGTQQYLPKRIVGNTNQDFNACDEIWSFFKSLIN
ncbi:alpha/beta hydrolase family esterase [Maribellus maritimus]|uniref:alpha/beta hydrolase family esterase n=1 Tax=Maribellus maritimus TaxID=2870838 RepID=UPI001EEA130F|nr:PHB depolymerase family esterase [Maribellus maritimus]MCG6186481.1 dienelactone hydrolase family protein [Maribellus maritimus]